MSLFDCNHLVHVIVLWQMQKFMCYFTVFALFILNSRATSKYKPMGGLYLEGRFNGGFFALPVGGLIFEGTYTCRGLFSEFYGIDGP